MTWSSNIFSRALSWLARRENTIRSSQVQSSPVSPAGVAGLPSPAPPHHLALTEVLEDLAQPGDGPGHVPHTLDSVVLSGDAHQTGLPSLTDESNGKYFKPEDDISHLRRDDLQTLQEQSRSSSDQSDITLDLRL